MGKQMKVTYDYETFKKNFDTYKKMIVTIAYSVLGDANEIDDVVQETWIQCLKYRPDLLDWEEEKRAQYIRIVARNEAIRYYRKRQKVIPLDFQNRTMESTEQTVTGKEELEDSILMREMLNRVLDEMSEEFQDIFLLYYEHGFSHDEIAQMKGKKSSAIRKQLSRGMKKVKKRLEEWL